MNKHALYERYRQLDWPQQLGNLASTLARISTPPQILYGYSSRNTYNAALQAARAWMLHQGYRARGPDQQRTAVRFCEFTLGLEHQQQLALLDPIRRKRNRLIYEVAGLVSRQEAEQALEFAKAFVEAMRRLITGQPPLAAGGQ